MLNPCYLKIVENFPFVSLLIHLFYCLLKSELPQFVFANFKFRFHTYMAGVYALVQHLFPIQHLSHDSSVPMLRLWHEHEQMLGFSCLPAHVCCQELYWPSVIAALAKHYQQPGQRIVSELYVRNLFVFDLI